MIMAYEKFQTGFKVGDRIEVSPDAYAVTNRIARRIKTDGGAALFVDYGGDHAVGDSLRVPVDRVCLNCVRLTEIHL